MARKIVRTTRAGRRPALSTEEPRAPQPPKAPPRAQAPTRDPKGPQGNPEGPRKDPEAPAEPLPFPQDAKRLPKARNQVPRTSPPKKSTPGRAQPELANAQVRTKITREYLWPSIKPKIFIFLLDMDHFRIAMKIR